MLGLQETTKNIMCVPVSTSIFLFVLQGPDSAINV